MLKSISGWQKWLFLEISTICHRINLFAIWNNCVFFCILCIIQLPVNMNAWLDFLKIVRTMSLISETSVKYIRRDEIIISLSLMFSQRSIILIYKDDRNLSQQISLLQLMPSYRNTAFLRKQRRSWLEGLVTTHKNAPANARLYVGQIFTAVRAPWINRLVDIFVRNDLIWFVSADWTVEPDALEGFACGSLLDSLPRWTSDK